MTRTLSTFAFVAAAALAGCNQEGNTIVQQGPEDPMAGQMTNAGAVELPPSITASKVYRCKDNSLIYVDWLSDGNARAKESRDDYTAPTVEVGAEGSPLKGEAAAPTITYNGRSCRS